jgi:hypothetical protein
LIIILFKKKNVINHDISVKIYISTHDQIADFFAKGLSSSCFALSSFMTSSWCFPSPFACGGAVSEKFQDSSNGSPTPISNTEDVG